MRKQDILEVQMNFAMEDDANLQQFLGAVEETWAPVLGVPPKEVEATAVENRRSENPFRETRFAKTRFARFAAQTTAVTVKARLNEGEPATDYVACIKSMVCVEQSNSPACKRDGLVSGLLTFALSRCSAYKVRTLLKGVNQSPVLLNGLGLKREKSTETEITDKVSVSSVTSRDQERDATLCTANQYVKSNVCTDCAAGTTNRAGDDPSGADTTCDATLCTANKYVKSNVCTDCAPGTTNVAGDNASGANTTCDATLCKANQYVKSNVCTDCESGTTNVAGDNASGADTECDDGGDGGDGGGG